MRTITIAEVSGQWVVTVRQAGVEQPQHYFCESAAITKRWAALLGGTAPRRDS